MLPTAERLRGHLERHAMLKHASVEAQNIETTRAKLAALVPEITRAATHIRIVHKRLSLDEQVDGAARIREIAVHLRRVREDFTGTPLQTQALASVERKVRELDASTARAWRQYATADTRDVLALYELLAFLPELQEDTGQVKVLVAAMRDAAMCVPASEADLDRFDANRLTLEGRLMRVEGVSVSVRQFLHKVSARTATLADLDDEVLRWCRQGERVHVFAIHVVSNAGE